jgi:hypothetical protein
MVPKPKRRPARGGAVDQVVCSIDRTIAITDPASQVARPIASIRVGERHRRDLGDVDGLAADMVSIGLLEPIVVTPEGLLLCGERRLRAAKLLGWKTIPVTIRGKPR